MDDNQYTARAVMCGRATVTLDRPVGIDGLIAEDLLVTFDPSSGFMTDAARSEIWCWAGSWLSSYPDAVVVMGCNGKARNSARATREARLQALGRTLTDSGVPADWIRYTAEALDLNSCTKLIAPERGVVCIKVLSSAVLDTAVMPISDLFRPVPPAGDHETARNP